MGFIKMAYISSESPPPSVEAAYKFLNYIIGPEWGERIGLKGRYATVTTLGQDGLSDAIKEEIFLKYVDNLDDLIEFMIPPRDPDTNKLNYDKWIKIWNEVKAE